MRGGEATAEGLAAALGQKPPRVSTAQVRAALTPLVHGQELVSARGRGKSQAFFLSPKAPGLGRTVYGELEPLQKPLRPQGPQRKPRVANPGEGWLPPPQKPR